MQLTFDQMNFLKAQHIHFLLPMYGGQCSESTMLAMMNFAHIATKLGIGYSVNTTRNESLITRGRNNLVSQMMANPLATHMFFIDVDLGFDVSAILRLVLHDLDVVGGLYPMKALPIRYVVNTLPNPLFDEATGLVEVSTLGTGFLCVKRHVIERMFKEFPQTKYKDSVGIGAKYEPFMYALFDTMIDPEGHYLSEDWTFCYRWRTLGGRCVADLNVKLNHTGHHVFEGDTDQLKHMIMPTPEKETQNEDTQSKEVKD